MVTVVLRQDWRDPDGGLHESGSSVDVPADVARSLTEDEIAYVGTGPRVQTVRWKGPTMGPRRDDPEWR
jgi:hypothetical protein